MQFLEGGSPAPNGRPARPAEGETPDATGGRGSLMARYRAPGHAGPEEQTPPPPRDGAEAAAPLPPVPPAPVPPEDSPWRDSTGWTSPPPRPPVDRPAPTAAPVAAPGADAPVRPDGPRPDGPRTDASRTDSARTDAPRTDAGRTDGSRADAFGTGSSRTDGSRTDGSRTDGSRTDGSRTDGSRAEAARVDAPPAESRPGGSATPAGGTTAAPAKTPVAKEDAPAVTVTRGSTPGSAVAPPPRGLLSTDQTGEFKQRWRELQGDFVDDPQQAVRSAGDLAREVLDALAATIAAPDRIESWQAGDGSSGTEDLRQALRQYRTLVDRLLEI